MPEPLRMQADAAGYGPEPGDYSEPPAAAGMPIRVDHRQVGGEHYHTKSIQPWDAMAAWFTRDEYRGFLKGNAIKYLAREREKGRTEDLKKARHYLDKLIEFDEGR